MEIGKKVTDATASRMFMETAAFFNRAKYAYIIGALTQGRPLLLFARNFFALFIRFRITRFAGMIILILTKGGLKVPREADFLFWGDSANNQKVLKPLHDVLAKTTNYDLTWGGRPASIGFRFATLSNMRVLWRLSGQLSVHRDVNAFAALQLLTLGTAMVFFDHALTIGRHPKVIVMANDHSPICVALRASAQARGIKTVYRQHAPVTPSFPPLKFDLSILFDEISKSYYTMKKWFGTVLILSPFDSDHCPIKHIETPEVVGLCLSVVWKEMAVKQVIKELLVRPGVTRVLLRMHPADKRDPRKLILDKRVVVQPSGQSSHEFCSQIDLAIVPNTGFVIEALHFGTPCIYRHGMDALDYDLYGFVEEGILPDYTGVDMSDAILPKRFFSSDWAAAFARFDATVDQSVEASRAQVRDALVVLHATSTACWNGIESS